jgi:hypothetical protein
VKECCHLQYDLPCSSCAVGSMQPSGNFNCLSFNNISNMCSTLLTSVTPAFLSYLNCVINPSLKNLLYLFCRLSSQSPPPDFPPFRHRVVSSSFSAEPPVPFPFPLAPLSRYITIVSRSAACACPAAIVGAARVSYLFYSHILFKSILFLS